MKRYISVRVVDSGGRPAYGARVQLWVYQFLASGFIPEKLTDREGLAEFDIDVDASAELSVSVNGDERVRRGSIRGEYRITI